jgi:hypothetical protein
LHCALDLGIGDTWVNKQSEPNDGDARAKTGLIAHQRPCTLACSVCRALERGPIVTRPIRQLPTPRFPFLAPELFNFELVLYRTAGCDRF